jgi:hypothetical protein
MNTDGHGFLPQKNAGNAETVESLIGYKEGTDFEVTFGWSSEPFD